MVMFSGIMRILRTTMYFENEEANASDAVLNAVPLSRRNFLISKQEKKNLRTFDIRLRGQNETPFFDD